MISKGQRSGLFGPGFTYADCTESTVITGMDGVMVPLVTEEQKVKRRKSESKRRKEAMEIIKSLSLQRSMIKIKVINMLWAVPETVSRQVACCERRLLK